MKSEGHEVIFLHELAGKARAKLARVKQPRHMLSLRNEVLHFIAPSTTIEKVEQNNCDCKVHAGLTLV